MTQDRKSLNELFRKASAQADGHADGNVLSQSEVERLLRNSNARSVPVTLRQQLFERLLSTPLKIGMTAMTTAALIALGIFALGPSNSNTPSVQKPIVASKPQSANHSTAPQVGLEPMGKLEPEHVQIAPIVRTLVASPTPIASADSLHPIELSEVQLAKLGIVLEQNGDIDFYTKDGTSINLYGLPPTWGLRLQPGKKHSAAELPAMTLQTSAPRLVTEPNGAKRLFFFESDTAYTEKNAGQTMHVQMQNQAEIVPRPDRSKGADTDAATSTLIKKGVNIKTSVIVSDSTITPELRNRMVPFDIDSMLASTDLDSILAAVAKDSVLLLGDGERGGKFDSVLRQVKNIISRMRSIDTSEVNSGSTVKVEIATHDSLFKKNSPSESHANVSTKVIRINRLNTNGTKTDKPANIDDSDLNEDIPIPPVPPVEEMEQAANDLDLSKLIPIRVVNNKNPDHPNTLIFWYDPTPAVEAALPKSKVEESIADIKHVNVSIYPNPTPGVATLHFDLAGANEAQYAIRNLLGQEVMAGGALLGSTGDIPLDLSKLDAGVYLLVTTTASGVPDVERVVVAK